MEAPGCRGEGASKRRLDQRCIRNVSIVGAVGHGKSVLARALGHTLAAAAQGTDQAQADSSSGDGLLGWSSVQLPAHEPCRRLNVVDTPGQGDLLAEVGAGLRLTDGALVVVDCMEGMRLLTETALRYALSERVKPVLVISKLDQAILEHKLPEALYERLCAIVAAFNGLVSTLRSEGMSDSLARPDEGSVVFASGLHGWGFTLHTFAERLRKALGGEGEAAQITKRLWGDHFYDPDTKTWLTTSVCHTTGKKLRRGFCRFVLEPIYKIIRGCLGGSDKRRFRKTHLRQLDIKLDGYDHISDATEVMKSTMATLLPLPGALVKTIAEHLPSPMEAQVYRAEVLYAGSADDECSMAIARCDEDGPLMLHIAKLVLSPGHDAKERTFYALGRVFAGTVVPGRQVRVLASSHNRFYWDRPESKLGSVAGLYAVVHGRFEPVDAATAGDIVILPDDCFFDSGTITSSDITLKHSFRPILRPSFVIGTALQLKNTTSLPRDITAALRRLSGTCLGGQCWLDEYADEGLVICGAGTQPLELLVGRATTYLASLGVEFTSHSAPAVSLRETVTAPSSQVCLTKSPNKNNRLYMTAEPLPPGLADAIDTHDVDPSADPHILSRQLYTWNVVDSRQMWGWGPNERGPNALFDMVLDTGRYCYPYRHEVKSAVVSGFNFATQEGVLCGEPVRGVRFNLVDTTLHPDARRRGAGQIIPTARRGVWAALMAAQPRLMEPVYLIEARANEANIDAACALIAQRRGQVLSPHPDRRTNVNDSTGGLTTDHNEPKHAIVAYLPVAESLGFWAALREATGGANVQFVFDHWQLVEGDPRDPSSRAGQLVLGVRRRKGLKEEIPSLDDLVDKL